MKPVNVEEKKSELHTTAKDFSIRKQTVSPQKGSGIGQETMIWALRHNYLNREPGF